MINAPKLRKCLGFTFLRLGLRVIVPHSVQLGTKILDLVWRPLGVRMFWRQVIVETYGRLCRGFSLKEFVPYAI